MSPPQFLILAIEVFSLLFLISLAKECQLFFKQPTFGFADFLYCFSSLCFFNALLSIISLLMLALDLACYSFL